MVDQTLTATDSLGLTDGSPGWAHSETGTDVLGLVDALSTLKYVAWLHSPTDTSGPADDVSFVWNRAAAYSETGGLTDSFAIAYTRSQTDSTGSSDSASPVKVILVVHSDSAGLVDGTAAVRESVLDEATGLTDGSVGAAHSLVGTDDSGLGDSSVSNRGSERNQTDSAGLTDAVALVQSTAYVVAQDEDAGLSDEALTTRTVGATDLAGTADSTAFSLSSVLEDDDTGAADTTALTSTLGESDSTGLVDATSLVGVYLRTPTDSTGLVDTAAALKGSNQTYTVTDSVGSTDSAVTEEGNGQFVTITDDTGLSDPQFVIDQEIAVYWDVPVLDSTGSVDNLVLYQTFVYSRAPTDSSGSTDSITLFKSNAYEVSADDDTSLTDDFDVVHGVVYATGADDTTGASDDAVVGITRPLSLTDDTGLTDAPVLAEQHVLTITDVSDDDNDHLTFGFGRTRIFTDSAGLTDSASRGLSWSRALADNTGLTDGSVGWAHAVDGEDLASDGEVIAFRRDYVPTDSTGTTDSAVASRALLRAASDDTGLTEDVTVTSGPTITDATGATDSFRRAASYTRPFTDNTGLLDGLTLGNDKVLTLSDNAGSTDAAATNKTTAPGYFRTFNEDTGLTDGAVGTAHQIQGTDETGAEDAASNVKAVAGVNVTRVFTNDTGSTDGDAGWAHSLRGTDDSGSEDTAVPTKTTIVTARTFTDSTGLDDGNVGTAHSLLGTDYSVDTDSASVVKNPGAANLTRVVTDSNGATDPGRFVDWEWIEDDDLTLRDTATVNLIVGGGITTARTFTDNDGLTDGRIGWAHTVVGTDLKRTTDTVNVVDINGPPPPTTRTTKWGYWVPAGTPESDARAALGAPQIYRHFPGAALPGSFVGTRAQTMAPSAIISFKYSPADILAGTYDTQIKAYFNSIPSTSDVWWAYWHEPEDDIENGSFTASDFRAAYRRLLSSVVPKKANLHPTMILMEFSLHRSNRPLSNYLDSTIASQLEALTFDAYLASYNDPASVLLGLCRDAANTWGLKWAIAETSVQADVVPLGSGRDAGVNTYVRDMQNWIDAHPSDAPMFVTWFEENKNGGGGVETDWRLAPLPTAAASWKNYVLAGGGLSLTRSQSDSNGATDPGLFVGWEWIQTDSSGKTDTTSVVLTPGSGPVVHSRVFSDSNNLTDSAPPVLVTGGTGFSLVRTGDDDTGLTDGVVGWAHSQTGTDLGKDTDSVEIDFRPFVATYNQRPTDTAGAADIGITRDYEVVQDDTAGRTDTATFSGFRPSGAVLTTISTLTATGIPAIPVASMMSAASTLDVDDPTLARPAAAALTATSDLTVNPSGKVAAAAPLTASSTLLAATTRVRPASASLSATAALSTSPVITRLGTAALSSASTLTTTSVVGTPVAAVLEAVSTLTSPVPTTGRPAVAILEASSTLLLDAVQTRRAGVVFMTAFSILQSAASYEAISEVTLTAVSTLLSVVQGVGLGNVVLTAQGTLLVGQPLRVVPAQVALLGASTLDVADPETQVPVRVVLSAQSSLDVGDVSTEMFRRSAMTAVSTLRARAIVKSLLDKSPYAFARMIPNLTYADIRDNETNAIMRSNP